jgi:UDP-2,4-diacetamido-2,4,6-trideoxy-beta-L-altropyranose hydrolase
MNRPVSPLVLFVVAAGPELGFGHLVRAGHLADALGVRRELVVTGSETARQVALRFGWTVHCGRDPIGALAPDLVVVDDPSRARVGRWVRQVREARIPIAAIEDGRSARSGADLVIDGSVASAAIETPSRIAGPAFAILAKRIAERTVERPRRDPNRVLVALGGGAHVGRIGAELARAIVERVPGVRVDLASGFVTDRHPDLPARCRWIHAPDGLITPLSRAAVAVVAGGVTLHEACALECPSVALAVVPAQRRAIRAAAARETVIDAGAMTARDAVSRSAEAVAILLADRTAAYAMGRRAARLVDGRGVLRVSARLQALAGISSAPGWRHAA